VVAKLDRLSRDVEFISGLMSRRVPFIVAALASIRLCCTFMTRWPSRSVATQNIATGMPNYVHLHGDRVSHCDSPMAPVSTHPTGFRWTQPASLRVATDYCPIAVKNCLLSDFTLQPLRVARLGTLPWRALPTAKEAASPDIAASRS